MQDRSSRYNAQFVASIAAFLIMAVPLVATVADVLDGPDSDREELVAKTPTFDGSLGDLKDYISELRYYVQKRYGLKQLFVGINSLIKTHLFAAMPYADVLHGQNGFLFLGVPEAVTAHQRTDPFTREELEKWDQAVGRLSRALEQRGSRYTLVIAADKLSVYSEYLPHWADAHTEYPSRSATLAARLQRDRLPVVDVLPVMLEAKKDATDTLYYRTDTHWNEYGASIATRHVAEVLGLGDAGDPQLMPFEASHAGDLARMIGQQGSLHESGVTPVDYPGLRCKHDSGEPFRRNEPDPLFPLSSRLVICKNAHGANGTAVVFIDSFGVSMIPSLSCYFATTVFAWQYDVDFELIRRYAPQHVLQLIAARKLQTLDPAELVSGLAPAPDQPRLIP